MNRMKLIVGTIAATVATAPAAAVVTTFASFSTPHSALDLRFRNIGNATARTVDADIFTTTSASETFARPVSVKFSFLQDAFAALPVMQNIDAKFTLSARVTKNTPALTTTLHGTTYFDQPEIGGSFSFVTTSALTVTGPNFAPHTYASGSNLLSGTFTGADLFGTIGGTSGSTDASTFGGDTITFTSDFLNFTPTIERELSLAFTDTAPSFATGTGANKALKSFFASAGGQFSSDAAPIVYGLRSVVPEPDTWVLMVAGFGFIGISTRRHAKAPVT